MKIPDMSYRSPMVRYDPLAQVEIFERRDASTGVVTFQTPSAQVVRELQADVPIAPAAAAAAGTAPQSNAAAPARVSLVV